MALIPLTYKLDWYNPSEPGGTISTINNNANLATSFDTQYSMQDIIDTVSGVSGIPWPYQYTVGDANLLQGENPGATGVNNTTLGVGAGSSITAGQNNVFIGSDAGRDHTGGGFTGQNVAVGNAALRDMTTGRDNTAVGHNAGLLLLAAQNNTAIGQQAMYLNTAGDDNTSVGSQTMRGLQSGDGNTGLGYYAMAENQLGSNNVAIGKYAAQRMKSGSPTYTVCVGTEAGDDWDLGASNTVIGGQAGSIASPQSLGAGTENVLLGFQAATLTGADNNSIVIGANARGVGLNTVVLGDSNITSWQPGADDTVSLGDKLTRGFKELILVSPDGTKWSVTVDNAGNLVVA
jgi:hypothetical protein